MSNNPQELIKEASLLLSKLAQAPDLVQQVINDCEQRLKDIGLEEQLKNANLRPEIIPEIIKQNETLRLKDNAAKTLANVAKALELPDGKITTWLDFANVYAKSKGYVLVKKNRVKRKAKGGVEMSVDEQKVATARLAKGEDKKDIAKSLGKDGRSFNRIMAKEISLHAKKAVNSK